MLPRNDQSPPDRKRPRRSPLSSEQGPPMGSANYPPQGQQPGGGQGVPQQLPNGMMRPMNAPGLNGFPQAGMQMANSSGMNMQMGGQPMGGPQMSPQTMPTQQQQVSSHKCHAKHIIIFSLVDGAISARATFPVHAESTEGRFICFKQSDVC